MGIASPWGAARQQEPWGKAAASGALPGNLLPAVASQEGSEPSYLMHEEPQDDLFIGGALRLHILFQLLGCKCSEIRVWSLGWWRSSMGPAFGTGTSLGTRSSYQGHVCSSRAGFEVLFGSFPSLETKENLPLGEKITPLGFVLDEWDSGDLDMLMCWVRSFWL